MTKMAKTVTDILKLSPRQFVSNIRHQHRCSHLPELKPLLQDFFVFLCIFPILLAFDAFHFSAVQQAFYFQHSNSLFQQLDLRQDFRMICRSLIEWLSDQSESFRSRTRVIRRNVAKVIFLCIIKYYFPME